MKRQNFCSYTLLFSFYKLCGDYVKSKKAVLEKSKTAFLYQISIVFNLAEKTSSRSTYALSFPAGVQTGYLPLPSPHIPIAALAANRVIIIVINITFYLLKNH